LHQNDQVVLVDPELRVIVLRELDVCQLLDTPNPQLGRVLIATRETAWRIQGLQTAERLELHQKVFVIHRDELTIRSEIERFSALQLDDPAAFSQSGVAGQNLAITGSIGNDQQTVWSNQQSLEVGARFDDDRRAGSRAPEVESIDLRYRVARAGEENRVFGVTLREGRGR
jgi:hypothetical protein